MERRLKEYLMIMEKVLGEDCSLEEASVRKKELLVQIGFFQHEREIHLLVTIAFALLTMMVFTANLFLNYPGMYLLFLLFLVLLIPYIRHYYILENGVQKLYTFYDALTQKENNRDV